MIFLSMVEMTPPDLTLPEKIFNTPSCQNLKTQLLETFTEYALFKGSPRYSSVSNCTIGSIVIAMSSEIWKTGGFFKGVELPPGGSALKPSVLYVGPNRVQLYC